MGGLEGSAASTLALIVGMAALALGGALGLAAVRTGRAAQAEARRLAAELGETAERLNRLLARLETGEPMPAGRAEQPAAHTAPDRDSAAPAILRPARAPEDPDRTLTIGAPPSAAAEAGEATMIAGHAVAADPRAAFHGQPCLKVTAGAAEGTGYRLSFGTTTLGRAPGNTIVLAEEKASRNHAEIRYEENRFVLVDNNSTNGTLHNGQRITRKVLDFGDTIRIGGTEMVFTCEGFELKDSDPRQAILAFERTLQDQPDFVTALKTLAFLLERDVGRQRDAQAVWDRLAKLERKGRA